RRVGPFGVGGLSDQKRAFGRFGEVRRDLLQESELFGAEEPLARLAVEREHPPRLATTRPERDEQLLVAAQRAVPLPARAVVEVFAGRLVQRGCTAFRARDA